MGRTTPFPLPLFLISLLLVAVVTSSATAFDGAWFDTRFQKQWTLTESKDEILVLFEPGATEIDREILTGAWGILPKTVFDPVTGAQVYRVPPGAGTAATRQAPPGVVRAVVPAVVDQEGYAKYYLPGQATVQFKKQLTEEQCLEKIHAAGASVIEDHWTPGYYTIALPEGESVFAAVRAWYTDPDVLFSEPSYLCFNDAQWVPNDPMFGLQWHLRNTGQNGGTPGADIEAGLAWDVTRGDPNVLVCVIDTGMDLTHEDLAANLLPRDGADWDFASSDGSPDDEGGTPSGHGTNCAGLAIAVQDNLIGVTGVAPACRVMPLRVNLDGGMNQNRADAINYAASRRREFYGLVMSCSWRMTSGDFTAVRNAIVNADSLDCVMVFASGNGNTAVSYPAVYPETIACGATNWCDQRQKPGACVNDSWGSNYGPELDVMAPGEKVVTTDMTGTAGSSPNNYNTSFSGTSAATPVAAGVCALIWSVNPYLSAHQVRAILEQTAEDQVGVPNEDQPGWDPYYGWGRVNANQAVLAAIETIFVSDFEDDLEGGEDTWVHSAQSGGYEDAWHLSQQRNHTGSGANSYKCGAAADSTDHGTMIHAALRSPAILIGQNTLLEFWHWIDAFAPDDSTAGDGGILEISSNGGISWTRLDPAYGGYTHVWADSTVIPFSLNTPLWSGSFDWRRVTVPMNPYQGQMVSFRYRYGTRGEEPTGEGWYIDDVAVYLPGNVLNESLETGAPDWSHGPAAPGGLDSWHLSQQENHSPGGTTAFKCGSAADSVNYDPGVHAALESPALRLTGDLFLSFWHRMDAHALADSGVDGGILEITSDYGNTWTRVDPILGGYTYAIPDSTGSPFEAGTPVWSGSLGWQHVVADLTAYSGQTVRFRLRFAADGDSLTGGGWFVDDFALMTPSAELAEDFESGAADWSHAPGAPAGLDSWHLSQQQNHTPGGTTAYKCGSAADSVNYDPGVHAVLESPVLRLTGELFLSFWHRMDAHALADSGVDGGILEIKAGNGNTWTRVEPILGGYTHSIPDSTGSPFEAGTPVWSGSFDWRHVVADLTAYSGQTICLRLRFAADGDSLTGGGWYVDDFALMTPSEEFAENFESGGTTWTHAAVGDSASDGWHVSFQRNHTEGGGSSFKCGSTADTLDYAPDVHAVLESPDIYLGSRPSVSFWHWMDAYATYDTTKGSIAGDGGILEISSDAGTTWATVVPSGGGYTHVVPDSSSVPFPAGSKIWSGSFDWTHVTTFLEGYDGRYVKLRLRFGARGDSLTGEGWYVDDFVVHPVGETAAEDAIRPFSDLVILPNAPNPFEGETSLRYTLGRALPVRVEIFDVSGRRVRLWDRGAEPAGPHALPWDGRDDGGHPVAAGIYFSRISAGRLVHTGRLALLR